MDLFFALLLLLPIVLMAAVSLQVHRLSRAIHRLTHKENKNMAIAQDILDAVTAENSIIDSFLTLVQGLIDNNTIPAATGAAILQAIADEKAKVEAAIVANTPVQP